MSIYNLEGVKVGDTIYDSGFRSFRRSEGTEDYLTVSKVARKYLTVESENGLERQFDISTGMLRAEYGGYKVYRSKEAHEEIKKTDRLGREIRLIFGDNYYRNPNISLETLVKIADLLGIEHEK